MCRFDETSRTLDHPSILFLQTDKLVEPRHRIAALPSTSKCRQRLSALATVGYLQRMQLVADDGFKPATLGWLITDQLCTKEVQSRWLHTCELTPEPASRP